jgi:methionyl-tRNA synthetase
MTCPTCSTYQSGNTCKNCGHSFIPEKLKCKIKPRSEKRKKQENEYLRKRKKYLEIHHICEVKGCANKATTIHHQIGRIGD